MKKITTQGRTVMENLDPHWVEEIESSRRSLLARDFSPSYGSDHHAHCDFKTYFKESFVEMLKQALPPKIKEIEIEYPPIEDQIGYVRFNRERLDSVYLINIRAEGGNMVTLKFNCRRFDHIPNLPADFVFRRIYFSNDQHIDYGYDEELELDSKYMLKPSIPPDLSPEDLNHWIDVLVEWREKMRRFHDGKSDQWVTVYQIERDGERVKNPYTALAPAGKMQRDIKRTHHTYGPFSQHAHYGDFGAVIDEMVENFALDKCAWAYRGQDAGSINFAIGIPQECHHEFMGLWKTTDNER